MKRVYVFLILCFGALGWAMYIYQAQQNDLLAKKIEDSVLAEIDFRIKTEQKIKSDIESKQKEKEFLEKQETERILEDSFGERISELKSENEKSLAQISETLLQRVSGVESNISGLESELNNDKQQLGQVQTQFLSGIKEIKEANELQFSAVRDRLDKNNQQLDVLTKQLADHRKLIDENVSALIDLKKQVKILQERLAATGNS